MEHKHRCPKCKTVWQHGDTCNGCSNCHRCPGCGYKTSLDEYVEALMLPVGKRVTTFHVYFGKERADYIFVDLHDALTIAILQKRGLIE